MRVPAGMTTNGRLLHERFLCFEFIAGYLKVLVDYNIEEDFLRSFVDFSHGRVIGAKTS